MPIIQPGQLATGSYSISGSFSGSFTGNIIGTITGTATSASYAETASYAVSASHEIIKEVSSSHANVADTASYVLASNIDQPFTNITASNNISSSNNLFAKQLYVEDNLAIDYSDGIAIGNITDPVRLLNNVTASGNISASGNIIGSDLLARDGRFSRDGFAAEIEIIAAESVGGIIGTNTSDNLILRRFNIPKFTISESRNFSNQDLDVQGHVSASAGHFTGDIAVLGTASITTLHTIYETSSVIYASGSTKFGDTMDDTHIRTGSLFITGSTTVVGGAYTGDGSGLTNIPAAGIVGLNLSQIVSGSYSASVDQVGNFSTNAVINGSGEGLTNIPASAIVGLNLSQIASGSATASISPDKGLELNSSMTISSGSGIIISGSTPRDAIVISGSNDRTRLHIYDTEDNNSPAYTEGAGIVLTGGEGAAQAILEMSAVGSTNGGSNNEQTFIRSSEMLTITGNSAAAGDNIKLLGSNGYGLRLDAGTSAVSLQYFTNGGSTVSTFEMANGTYLKADANGSYLQIGRSSDWLVLNSNLATFRNVISGSAVSASNATFTGDITASGNISSSGTYIGDGSGLTNIPASGITGLNLSQIASGSATASISPDQGLIINTDTKISGATQITGSLIVSGSFNAFRIQTNDVLLGDGAGNNTSVNANGNVMVGYQAGYTNTTGDKGVVIGYQAGYNLGTNASDANVLIGNEAGKGGGVTTGGYAYNVFLGTQAGYYMERGDENVGIGAYALRLNQDGHRNIAIGKSAIIATLGNDNIGIGHLAGGSQTTGTGNITIGSGSLGVAGESNQLRIGNGNSITTISASLATGDILLQGDISSSAASTASFGTYLGDGSQLDGVQAFPFSGSAIITGSLTVSQSVVDFSSASQVLLPVPGTIPLINPKVEYATAAAITSSGVEITLPNSLTYESSSVYEYLEIFINGLRLRYNVDFIPFTTASVKYNIAIPSGSEVTYKSIKQPT